jgi:serine/threonine protein kinase/Tol biopolymer transport system component
VIGSTISHYQILDRLGGGGMGVVYKALDLRLDRLVALKFLSSQRGADEEQKRRFIREARAASLLDHPNICTIYEIDDTGDGALFIAMALYEGETLRERIGRGPLPIPEAVAIALQIASGLARAHERGIVHRDVKPSNVILAREGQVKLVDFGIAKLAGQSRLTIAGTAMGTAAYMSPEQFDGESVDLRTDVWSLGAVAYEMVAGRPPFGSNEREAVRGILERHPTALSARRPDAPPALERIVGRALAKRPSDRYASMDAMRDDLQRLAATLAPPEPPEPEDRTAVELPAPAAVLQTAAQKTAPREAVPQDAVAEEIGDGLIGRTIGPYQVLEILGGGGMGVVYKALDARLARTAALKFLPPELTRDPGSKERFVQEARAASGLDHPNLCTILELGEGPDGRLYLAMPCYDGETLRRRIERGPLPVLEAIDIGEQIARGLSKAHRHGIVHRDIKPANVIVTADGVVKILDFGLAKLAGSAALSRTGPSAGTPAYMSPEQARGGDVDPRTDLWSLGVILYEMLAGRRPFRGEREHAVIFSILNERPEPLSALRPEIPPELARLVDRLLAKDPEERPSTIDEPLAELRALKGETATGTQTLRPMPQDVPSWVWGAAAAALAVLGILAAGLYLFPPRAGKRAAAAPVEATFTRLTDQEGSETFPSLSPDGGTFLYARHTGPANLDIYSQRIGGSNPVNLTADSPVNDTQPAFSPDGGTIAFRSERDGGGIFLMGATGESVRRLTDFGYNPDWSPDGKQILVATEGVSEPQSRKTRSQVWRVDVATGARALLVPGDAVQPRWSPHRLRVAYWGLPTGSAERALWTIPAGGGPPVAVTRDEYFNWSPAWSPDGRYLYFASNRGGSMNLWRVPIEEATGRTLGAPEPITAPSEWSGLLSLSRDGRRIVYSTSENRANLERLSLDPATLAVGSPRPVTRGSRGVYSCDVSPNGRELAFYTASPQEDLFLVRTDGSGLRQLTDDTFRDRQPRWSPDGSRLVFQSDRSGRYELWSLRKDGSGLEPVTRTIGSPLAYPVWSPDGRRLALAVATRGAALLDLALPLERRKPVPLPPIPGEGQTFYAVAWSPDGKWLAGSAESSDSRSLPGVVLYSLESKSYRRLTTHGEVPRWMPDGRSLLVLDQGGIRAVDLATGSFREVVSPPPGSSFVTHCVSRDGRNLFASRLGQEGDICMLTLR